MGQNIYMLPSDMNLKIRSGTVRYNNKILVSDEKFSLGKNGEVNAGLAKPEEETRQKPTTIHKVVTQAPQLPAPVEKTIITHEDEKIALILFLTGGFTCFDEQCTAVRKIQYDFTHAAYDALPSDSSLRKTLKVIQR